MTQRPAPDPVIEFPERDSALMRVGLLIGLVGAVMTVVGGARRAHPEGALVLMVEGMMAFFSSAMWAIVLGMLLKGAGMRPTALPAAQRRPARTSVHQPEVKLSPDLAVVSVRLPRGRGVQWFARNERCCAYLLTVLAMLSGPVLLGWMFRSSWVAVVPVFGCLTGLVLAIAAFLGVGVVMRPLRSLRTGQLEVTHHWLRLPDGARLDAAELSWAWRHIAPRLWVLEAVGVDGRHHTCCAGTEEELHGVASYVKSLLRPAREDFKGSVPSALAELRQRARHD